jgi:drug/metabolite transporter (DMT)-like permease
VHHAGASRASVITYINPVVATLLGVLVLHEHLGIGGAIAFALILLGSWLATRGSVAPAAAREVTLSA